MTKSLTLKPRISEKSYALSQTSNVYVMQVPLDANKLTVAAAVSAQFEVSVTNVNIVKVKGKTKRTVRKGGRQTYGTRPDIKKAYVTLKDGDSIPVFASEDDQQPEAVDTKSKKARRSTK